MKIHVLWSGLAASAVLLATGAAFSGGSTTNINRLVSFDVRTGHLVGYPTTGNLTTYLHDAATLHAAGDITKFLPPDPCIPTVEAWNATVAYDDRHGVNSTFVFEALLSIMSDFSCSATVTSVAGSPAPIMVISPVAD